MRRCLSPLREECNCLREVVSISLKGEVSTPLKEEVTISLTLREEAIFLREEVSISLCPSREGRS